MRKTVGSATALLLLAGAGWPGTPQGDSPAGTRAPRTVVIRMTDEMRFVPEHATIAPGDTVLWRNDGKMPHTTTDKPGTAAIDEHNVLPAGASTWDSGLLDPGAEYRVVLTQPGEYAYLCFLHETLGMVGRITVSSPPPPPPLLGGSGPLNLPGP